MGIGAISTRLEEDIVLGRLQPREHLVEQDLADRFGTHRAAVRQALFDLDKKGLIKRVPNRGALVRDLSPDDVRQIYAVREELESMAARIIPLPVAVSDIKRLEAIQKVHGRAVAAGDLRAVFYSNLEFHRALFGLCGNPYLIESIEQLAQKAYGIIWTCLTHFGAATAPNWCDCAGITWHPLEMFISEPTSSVSVRACSGATRDTACRLDLLSLHLPNVRFGFKADVHPLGMVGIAARPRPRRTHTSLHGIRTSSSNEYTAHRR
jgi:DNA-binding GntR family transcriptional regulator